MVDVRAEQNTDPAAPLPHPPPASIATTSRPEPDTSGYGVVEDLMHARRSHDDSAAAHATRRVDVSTAALGLRVRGLQSTNAGAVSNQVQITGALRGRTTIGRNGFVAIHGGLASGRGFNSGWNATGIGSGGAAHDLAVKQLFVAIRPLRHVDVEAGGLYFARGQSTEATSYDNDGYLVGERAVITIPPIWFVDTLSLTRGHVGDLTRASVFDRLRRLDRANYYQALGEKRIAGAAFSVDYTRNESRHVIRGGAAIDLNRRLFVDRIRVEGYARATTAAAHGYAISVQRMVPFALMSSLGISSIDAEYGPLNGDLYGRGRRLFGSVSKRFRRALLASAQVATALGQDTSPPRTRFDLSVAYDVRHARTPRPLQPPRANE
jgi:hypothetical protein